MEPKKKKGSVILVASVLMLMLMLCGSFDHYSCNAQEDSDQDSWQCYDHCTTGCVYRPDVRQMQRCEIKCGIICNR
ncbi:hypothetical protein LINPERPRIM_LOCUS26389 [Linum perenne]